MWALCPETLAAEPTVTGRKAASYAQSVSDSDVAWHVQDLFGFGLTLLHLLSLFPAGDAPPALSQTTGDDVEFMGWTYSELGAQVQHFQQRVRSEFMSQHHAITLRAC